MRYKIAELKGRHAVCVVNCRRIVVESCVTSGRQPLYGGTEKFQNDPNWRDHILFYEYFHGDNGAGIGASHQTGWTGVVAKLIQLFGMRDAKKALEVGKASAFVRGKSKE